MTGVVDGEIVILDVANGHIHQLNATAARIWHHCDGMSTAAEIAAHLAGGFNATPQREQVMQDVLSTLAEFERLGLLTAEPDGPDGEE